MQSYKKVCDLLSNEECKSLIQKLINNNPAQIALQYSGKVPCDASTLALIIQLYQKAVDKIPLWAAHYCAITPRSFEQATSQIVALYKSTFIGGKKLLIAGGGLGVDEWAFSKTFTTVVSIDPDEELNEIVAFNYPRLDIKNVERITTTAEEYFKNNLQQFDCIYTDPDRRDATGTRKITLAQSKPDIIALLPQIWERTHTLVIKASPMLDIKAATAELKETATVHVIAVKNEVKEILLTAIKGHTGPCTIIATNYNGRNWQEFSAPADTNSIPGAQPVTNYFYEPNVAIIKAGLYHTYAATLGLGLIDAKTAYYTGAQCIENFMGRVFEIVEVQEFSKKSTAAYLAANGITKANVAQRNFRMNTDELKKLFKIKDGGEEYLFFTQQNGKPLLYHCRRIKNR